MRRCTVLAVLLVTLPAAAEPTPAATLDLWPGKAPGETKDLPPEAYIPATPKQMDVKRLGNVSKPQVSVYLPAKDKAAGGCVVIAPGGGYNILAIEHESGRIIAHVGSPGYLDTARFGAIDMAKVELEHGKDPAIRKLAEDIVIAQEGEIKMMEDWLARNAK